jgi:ketoreductase
MNLEGKIAVITGGSAGIGKAIAVKLGEEGARIAICGRELERLRNASAELESKGIVVLHERCDVQNLAEVETFVERVIRKFGCIDILVNNAGAIQETPISEPDDAAWHRIIKTVLDGTYFFTTRSVKYMPQGARIVNISGVLGKMGVPGSSGYCAAKHGVIGFTKAVALELASRGITVNTICPGWVETDLAREVMESIAESAETDYETIRNGFMEQVPLGQMILPEEIASLVSFLVSPAAANITGQAYNICGGQVMH